jgi:GxxExxY protein
MKNFPHQELTKSVIGIYYNVYNELGFGFLEKVYHKSLLIELKKMVIKLILRKK